MTDSERRQPRTWDFFLTTLLILVLLVITGIFIVGGIGFGVTAVSCAEAAACESWAITLGSQLAMFGTPIVTLIAIIVAVMFIAKRRVAFWAPLIGILLGGGIYFLASVIVGSATSLA